MTGLGRWVLGIMLNAAPPGGWVAPPEAVETPEEGLERYESAAQAIADTVSDPDALLPFWGTDGAPRSAAMLASIWYWEGAGFARHVDVGAHRGDNGRSWCLGQINVGAGRTPEGWTGPELVADHRRCAAATLRAMRQSMNACRRARRPELELLNAYASGSCDKGARESRDRMNTGAKWFFNLWRGD